MHQRCESGSPRSDGAHAIEDARRQGTQTNHCVHCRCGYAGARDRLSLPVHGTARALQRSRKVHQRASASRKHHFKGRRRIKSRAHHVEHGATHTTRRLRWPFQAAPRNLAQMGRRTHSMGRADRQTRCNRRKNRRNGWQRFRHGSDDVPHFIATRS